MLPGLSDVVLSQGALWEYSIVVTSLDCEDITLAQLYRDRGDAANTFDELKNQWGWGGFTTQDIKRTQITARMTAIVYNWWSLFVQLVDPMTAREAITGRPLLLTGVARATNHASQTTLLQQPATWFQVASIHSISVSAILRIVRSVVNPLIWERLSKRVIFQFVLL